MFVLIAQNTTYKKIRITQVEKASKKKKKIKLKRINKKFASLKILNINNSLIFFFLRNESIFCFKKQRIPNPYIYMYTNIIFF